MSLEFAPDLAPWRFSRARTRTAGIAGLGAAQPDQVITNEVVGAGSGVTPEWIVKRTGISTRRHLRAGERLDALCAAAGAEALAQAGVPAAALDAVLVATSTADEVYPQCAPLVAALLGAPGAMAWDVSIACTGFVAGLVQGTALIESGRAERVLVVGADAVSRNIDAADKGPAALFGDGAGAAVLVRGGAGRVGASSMGSDGAHGEYLVAAREDGIISMNGWEIFNHAIARMTECSRAVLAVEGLTLEELALVVPHQANARITSALTERLGLRPEQVVDDIGDRGNTSAGTIPLALHRAAADGRIPERGAVLLTAFGAGLAWGATVLHYGARVMSTPETSNRRLATPTVAKRQLDVRAARPTDATILVTGAGGGIGAATALALALDGWQVAVGYGGNAGGAAETVDRIEDAGGRAASVGGDIGAPGAAEELVARAAELGPLLGLVNNAGVRHDGLALQLTDEEWDAVIATNLTAAFRLTRAVLKRAVRARYGRIVNVASVVGPRANGGQANYAAAKAGLIGMTKTVAVEVARRNVTVNAVAPGFIDTAMTADLPRQLLENVPARRPGRPEEVADAIAFLASDRASYVTGSTLWVDGGMGA